jgi:acyl-coenzyme A synthetase/AMP-(fatty) acid ligase
VDPRVLTIRASVTQPGGEKFPPEQIDTALLSHPKVHDALSFGVPTKKYGEEVNAAVILNHGQRERAPGLPAWQTG